MEEEGRLTTESAYGGQMGKVIAFALETSDGEARAAKKLVRKNADYIVLNSAAALNAASSTVTLIDANGMVWKREDRPKDETAVALMELF